jgi:hypothetical protein
MIEAVDKTKMLVDSRANYQSDLFSSANDNHLFQVTKILGCFDPGKFISFWELP